VLPSPARHEGACLLLVAVAHGVAEVEVSTKLLESDAQAHKQAK
jgi:hypothetical protein